MAAFRDGQVPGTELGTGAGTEASMEANRCGPGVYGPALKLRLDEGRPDAQISRAKARTGLGKSDRPGSQGGLGNVVTHQTA